MDQESVGVLIQQRAALQQELEEERRRRIEAEENLRQSAKNLQPYIEEIEKVAKSAGELVDLLEQRQLEGDRLRARLAKLITAYEALQQLYHATVAGVVDKDAFQAAWARATLELETPDG